MSILKFLIGSEESRNIAIYISSVLTCISIIFSASYYVSETSTRSRDARFKAWQILIGAEGKKGNGGRDDAIKMLKKKDNEDLSGIILDKAFINNIDLSGVNARFISMNDCTLEYGDFSRA